MTCSLCDARKAKRFCPAVRSEICPQCCGQEREETLDCPLDCPFLIEARQREKRAGIDPEKFPYKDIRVSETFLRQNEDLLTALGRFVAAAAAQTPGVADSDAREALDALARTYKSLQSGVYYQTMPGSGPAQGMVAQIQEMLQQFRAAETERTGVTRIRDVDVLGLLVFLLRMAMDEDNGRKRGRRFLTSLYTHFPPAGPLGPQAPLIVQP